MELLFNLRAPGSQGPWGPCGAMPVNVNAVRSIREHWFSSPAPIDSQCLVIPFVVATHLHEIADEDFSEFTGPEAATGSLADGRPADGGWFEGVCRDSFAGETLRHFGWEEALLAAGAG
ncbi:hypothetical protein AK812_SmicGene5901 [Symbiodinium microadriaticum]|uniref:Uncharacterized protein n=1 Tax=Symbiodinium microadriaticum TaxID=2951 RepID=A0A1Q9ESL5_SYMMI|nr:hypothetical protein AK812_SmicGene5901 [Symbiodinium microadriaticum]